MRSMKTLLRLLGAVSLTTVAASSVVACHDDKKEETIKIQLVLTEKNLGKITISEVLPTVQQIKEKIKEKNVNVDINAITISEITTTNAKVTGDDVKYTGNLYVVYTTN